MANPTTSMLVNIADGTDPTRLLKVNADGSIAAQSDPNSFYKGSNSIIRETIDRSFVRDNNLAIGTTGVMFSQAILLFAGDVITTICMRSGAQAAVTPTNYWFALYSSAATPALLSQTADQTTTAWAANTTKDIALAAPQTLTATGIYWLAVMMAGATIINMNGQGVASSTINGGLVAGMLPKSQTSGSALTATAPATITAGTATASNIYAIAH